MTGAGGAIGQGGGDGGGGLDTSGTSGSIDSGDDSDDSGRIVPDARSSFLDAGGVGLDGGGGADVKNMVATANRGCTCALGQTPSSQSGSVLLLGAIAVLVRRTARRRR